jgi:alkylhydroperoxidase/carboxymuconolactone decarboxylase family protein YurZ
MDTGIRERRERLKSEFTAARGYWSALWNDVLELSPDFFEAYMNFSSVPWKTGTLPPKIKELIYIAIDAATTHLYDPGLRIHIRNALRYGATRDEIMEVYQLTSVLGIHTCVVGVPALLEEMRAAGRGAELEQGPLSPSQQELKTKFIADRGYWSPLWDGLIRLSPEFFEAYLDFSSVPWRHGTLDPKVKELIYIAIDSSTTHLFEPGLKVHIRNALGYGATPAEIMEVFQLTSVLGIHTCTLGVPALIDEIAAAEHPDRAPA